MKDYSNFLNSHITLSDLKKWTVNLKVITYNKARMIVTMLNTIFKHNSNVW